MNKKFLPPAAACMLVLLACNLPFRASESLPTSRPTDIRQIPSLASPTQAPAPTVQPTIAALTGEGMDTFKVAILIDINSEPVDHEAALAVLQQASDLLRYQTGFLIGVTEIVEVQRLDTITGMAAAYLAGLETEVPHGLVIFSYGDEDLAREYGGYSGWVAGPDGYSNTYVSPLAGDQHVYLAVMHWSHRFGECGYGGTDEIISQTSVAGECRNQPGTTCLQQYGYSMCSNVVDNLYASTPKYFLAANIVHEFLHPFGTGTSDDHYGSPHCQAMMGWTEENWTFSVSEAEKFNGQCPTLYAAFDRAYLP